MTSTNDNLRVTNLFDDLIKAFDLDALFIDGISKKGKRVTVKFGDLRCLGRDRYETRHDVSAGAQVAAAAEGETEWECHYGWYGGVWQHRDVPVG